MKRFLMSIWYLILVGALSFGAFGGAAPSPATVGAMGILGAGARQEDEQGQDISMTVRYDYDDQVRLGVAVPAFVKIDNKGPAVEGILRVSVTPYGNETANAYEMPVHVPQESKVEYTLPFRVYDRSQNIKVHLIEKNRVVAEATRARSLIVFSEKLFVGILSDNPQGMAYWNSMDTLRSKENRNVQVTAVELGTEDFPEDFYMLDRFALLVLNHFDLGYLNDAQRSALIQWVQRGGCLLVDGDINAAQSLASLQPLVELRVTGELSAEDYWAQVSYMGYYDVRMEELPALGRVEPQGETASGWELDDLFMEYPVEAGKVFVTAFALDGLTFGEEVFDASIVFLPIRGLAAWDSDHLEAYDFGYSVNGYLQSAAKSISWLDAPPILWVVVILAVFIILAAPVSYLLLAKRDKRDWIWMSAPALALVFCVVIAGYGVVKHGSQTVSSVVTVVDLRKESHGVRPFSLVGIAAPRRGSYEVSFGETAFPFKMVDGYYYYYSYDSKEDGPAGRPAVRMDLSSGNPKVTFQQIPQWSMETIYLERELELEGGLEARAWYETDGLHYTVKNETGSTLEDVTIVSSMGYERIALLEPGEEAVGMVNLYSYMQSTYSYSYYSGGIDYWRVADEIYNSEEEKTEAQRREEYLKSNMVRLIFENSYSSRITDPAVIWAWSRELGDIPITANGKTVRNDLNRAMVVGDIEVTYGDNDEMVIPVGQLTGYIFDAQDVDGAVYMGESYAYFDEGEVTFAFELPDTVKMYDLDELIILGADTSEGYDVWLYNVETDEWDEFERGDYGLEIILRGDQAQDYIDWYGDVMLKVAASQEALEDGYGGVYIDYITIGVSGKEKADAGD